MITPTLLKQFLIISDQVDARELTVILNELERLLARGRQGNIVELGCYVGTTSLFIRRLMNEYKVTDEFHVYDSFAGLPEKTPQDISVAGDQFVAGALYASRRTLLETFKKSHLEPPIVHKGWFSDLVSEDMPDGILFAFLDGDYYESIRDSLKLVENKLLPGAVIIVDDYASEALPGAAAAADEWASRKGHRVQSMASLGIIRT
ncbi:MAG TPA: TylF/MycF/NovP-related O-methyltransferase [Candidatus Saccharimonadales bacterium]|nr:TylF/MycF/NovP-related O-methyltransferase [Candidatus Saccharimonadales bacterium]